MRNECFNVALFFLGLAGALSAMLSGVFFRAGYRAGYALGFAQARERARAVFETESAREIFSGYPEAQALIKRFEREQI